MLFNDGRSKKGSRKHKSGNNVAVHKSRTKRSRKHKSVLKDGKKGRRKSGKRTKKSLKKVKKL